MRLNMNNGLPNFQYWFFITSNYDGTILAAVINGGDIYISKNSGDNWEQHVFSSIYWRSIISDYSGLKLTAVDSAGNIWTTPDTGVTWKQYIIDY